MQKNIYLFFFLFFVLLFYSKHFRIKRNKEIYTVYFMCIVWV